MMKAHEGGGDIVGIERRPALHSTVYGHGTDANPCPGEFFGQCQGPHAQRRLASAQTRQTRVCTQRRPAACEQKRTGSRRAHRWRHERCELRRREKVDSHRALAFSQVELISRTLLQRDAL